MSRDDFRRTIADRGLRTNGRGKRRGRSNAERSGESPGPEPEDVGVPEKPERRKLRHTYKETGPGAAGAKVADATADSAALDKPEGSKDVSPHPLGREEDARVHGPSATDPRQRGVKYHRKFIESAEAEAAGKQGQKPSKLVFAPDELPPEQTASKLTERKRLPVSEVKARPKAPSASPQFGAAKNKGSAIVGGASPSPAGKGRHPAGSAATTDAALSLIRRPARGANDGDIGAETVDGMATAAESANKGKRKIEGYLAMCVPKG